MTASPDVLLFAKKVSAQRACGIVTSVSAPREPGAKELQAADQLAVAQGFAPLGERWRSIDLAGARQILVRILGRDLAYDAAVMPVEEAASLADQWLSLTSRPRAFLTNGTWAADPVQMAPRATAGPSWDPLTESTFDAGVVAMDTQRSLMLWVQDED